MGDSGYGFALGTLNGTHSCVESYEISGFVKPTDGYKCEGCKGNCKLDLAKLEGGPESILFK